MRTLFERMPTLPMAQQLPNCIYIEVANRCNSLCTTCPLTFGPQEHQKNLSWNDFVRIVAQFPQMERVVLHGIGEPLLNRELPRFIRYLKAERGSYVLFNTNATLLTTWWQRELATSGLDELRVSLDGATPATYLKLRGIPTFNKVVANIGAMVRTQHEMGSELPRLSLWFTGLKENIGELPNVLDLAAQTGVREVYLQRLVIFDEGLARADQSIYHADDERARVEAIIAECEAKAAALGLIFRGSGAVSPREAIVDGAMLKDAQPWQGCRRPWNNTYITANGNVLPCCFAPFTGVDYDSIILGNVFSDPEGFAGVWNNPDYLAFRAAHQSPTPHPACARCGLDWSL